MSSFVTFPTTRLGSGYGIFVSDVLPLSRVPPVGWKSLSGRRGDILAYIGADDLSPRQGTAGDGSCGA